MENMLRKMLEKKNRDGSNSDLGRGLEIGPLRLR